MKVMGTRIQEDVRGTIDDGRYIHPDPGHQDGRYMHPDSGHRIHDGRYMQPDPRHRIHDGRYMHLDPRKRMEDGDPDPGLTRKRDMGRRRKNLDRDTGRKM
jgi:hypothetical protein